MGDTLEMMDAVDADGLARKIAVAGLQVSQAADELQQAAERLMTAESQARDSETRAHVAEEQLSQSATKSAELLGMLEHARENQTEAEERMRRAEERLGITMERARLLEEQMAHMQAQVTELKGRLAETEAAPPRVTVIVDEERSGLQEAIAAEVRRPLTSILGLTLAMKHADTGSPDGRDMIRQLATNARKLDRLVGEMLDLDRIANGTFTPNRRRTDVEALVRRVVEESPDLANRDVHVSAEHVALEVDPALTEQMVETLLANAGRRTTPGNPVWVKVLPEDGGATIAVEDMVSEVPTGLRQALFASMQDGHGEPSRARGGTGLSLLSRFAELHGGKAWVEERPGGGASFRVFLPDAQVRANDEPKEADQGAVSLRPDERSEPAAGQDDEYETAAIEEDDAIAI